MNYLSVENLSYRWGDIELFHNINFGINEGQKVALVAKNGTGKTTLLKILTGQMEADSGRIVYNDDIKVAMLEQNPYFDSTATVIEQVLSSGSEVTDTLKQYEIAIEKNDLEKIGKLTERMDALQAWDYEARIRQILGMLKIHEFDTPVSKLSGGQQKRVALAQILIEQPDFLILDEPTNHLDLEIIDWLEEYLTRSNTTLLMVTHDRYFLDRVCNTILELDQKQLFQYQGNYSYYIEKRQQRLETQDAESAKARNLLRKEQDWMNRQPQARAGKAQYRIDAYYDLKKRAEKRQQERTLDLQFASARLGGKVIDAYNISKKFGDKRIVNDFSYKFAKGEKVAFIGNNGCGKTTLLNMLTGALTPDGGHIDTGDTVQTGYYKQEGIVVDENKTVIEVMTEIAEYIETGGKRMTAAQFLRYFLFPNEMHYVRVNKLSGGEKKRLYLLTVLIKNPNFLILDEPTNDLDILTLNCLEEYLSMFSGTLIIVSHDRYFVDKIVDHIFVFKGEGEIKDFPGNYSEYIAFDKIKQHEEAQKQKDTESKKTKPETTTNSTEAPVGRDGQPKKKRLSYKEQKELEQIEKDMEVLNVRIAEIEQLLSGGSCDAGEISKLSEEYSESKEKLDEMEMRWLELNEDL